jgi:copper resistance protein C
MKVLMKSAHQGIIFGVLLALVLGGSSSALAHNAVIEEVPTPGSTITQSPVSIRITTNDQLLDLGGAGRGFAITVQDSQGLYYGDGCVVLDETSLSSTVSLGPPDTYTITYQYVSADSHSLSDSYEVAFAPLGEHSNATGSLRAPVCGEEALSDPEESPGDARGDGESTQPVQQSVMDEAAQESNPWLITAGFAVAVLAGVVLILRTRKKNLS